MKAFSQKYYFHLDEFEHQVNDIWFNYTLKALKPDGKLYVPDLNKWFNKQGEEVISNDI